MAWMAFDRGVKALERSGLDGPLDRWRDHRDRIHAEVCARGYDPERKTFTQFYGSRELDASLLMLALVGQARQLFERLLATANDVGLLVGGI